MTGENKNGEVRPQDDVKEQGTTTERTFPISLLLVVILAAALLPGILSEDEAAPEVASGSEEIANSTLSVAPEPAQEFSPQALEDLRSVPILDLTINPEPLLLDPLPQEGTEDDEPTIAGVEEETPAPPEAPFSVGEALARYLLAIREELNSEYVANCIRFRNRNGAGADCPDNPAFTASSYQQEQDLVDELFAVITREEDYMRIRRRLENENGTLIAILDDPDNTAALQASTKLALNNAYLEYLSGNPSPAVTAFNTMYDFVNDYNRTIRVGPTQFICQGGPCVYEYTGPDAE